MKRPILLFTALLILNGCAWLVTPPESDLTAQQYLTRWKARNAVLKQFKGLLRVQLQAEGRTLRGRAALAGVVPDRLRVELLNTLGQPITSLAGDGDTIRVHDVSEDRFYQWNQSESALERFIHVPLGIDALLEILSGRPPVPAHAAAQMATATEGACVVLLKDRWGNTIADLRCDDGGRIQSFQVFDIEGVLQYEVRWEAWRELAGYTLPSTVRMASGRGDQVLWTLERFWPDVQIPSATFVLEAGKNP